MTLPRGVANAPTLVLAAVEVAAALIFGFGLDLTGEQVAGAMAVVAAVTGIAAWATAYGPRTVGDIMDAEMMMQRVARDERG